MLLGFVLRATVQIIWGPLVPVLSRFSAQVVCREALAETSAGGRRLAAVCRVEPNKWAEVYCGFIASLL